MSQFDLDDLPSNLSDNEHFQSVVDRVVSRRGFLKSGLGIGAAAFLAAPLAAQIQPVLPSPSRTAQGDVAVTIYNNNLALVQDARTLTVPSGRSRLVEMFRLAMSSTTVRLARGSCVITS